MILMIFCVFAFFSLLDLFAVTLAASVDGVASYHGSCGHLLERKEWYVVVVVGPSCVIDAGPSRRALSNDEKKDYIDAVKCLQSRPALNTSLPASWTRFDEFQAYHIKLAYQIHFVVSDPFTQCAIAVFLKLS